MFLQHLPTRTWAHHELEMVLSRAYMWHTMFKSSPSHLASQEPQLGVCKKQQASCSCLGVVLYRRARASGSIFVKHIILVVSFQFVYFTEESRPVMEIEEEQQPLYCLPLWQLEAYQIIFPLCCYARQGLYAAQEEGPGAIGRAGWGTVGQ